MEKTFYAYLHFKMKSAKAIKYTYFLRLVSITVYHYQVVKKLKIIAFLKLV